MQTTSTEHALRLDPEAAVEALACFADVHLDLGKFRCCRLVRAAGDACRRAAGSVARSGPLLRHPGRHPPMTASAAGHLVTRRTFELRVLGRQPSSPG